ncbi:MAG: Lrp/AsnC ligand binding domain-containing protein [Nanoarchaeota archaeon]|jgi:DNA-binding Lrp family transcriptional regulator
MIEAFVLVRVKPGSEIIVRDELEELAKDSELYMLYGEWDFLVKVEGKTLADLREFIIRKIRSLEGVTDTATLIVAESIEE